MRKEAYNFKEAFEHPVIIRQITDKFALPFGVRLSRIIVFAVVLFLMWVWRDFFNIIASLIPGLGIVLYIGVPYLVSGWLLKINVDGKKLHYFLYDYMIYLFTFKLPKKKFSHDEEVLYLEQKEIRLETVTWRKEDKDVTQNSIKKNQ